MRTARDKRLINGMIIATGGVLAIDVLSIWQYRRIQDNGGIIRHTNQVLFKTDEVLNEMMQYQLNVKNFLLTGRDLTGRSDLLTGRENLPDTAGSERTSEGTADIPEPRRVRTSRARDEALRSSSGSSVREIGRCKS